MPHILAASGCQRIRDGIQSCIEPLEHEFTIVETGKAALQILQTRQVDGFITDELLPDWDAYTIFRRMPVNNSGRKPPALMLIPPRVELAFVDEDLGSDAFMYMVTPVSIGEVQTFTKRMIEFDWSTYVRPPYRDSEDEATMKERLRFAKEHGVIPNQEILRSQYRVIGVWRILRPACKPGEILCYECPVCGFLMPYNVPTTMICPCRRLQVGFGGRFVRAHMRPQDIENFNPPTRLLIPIQNRGSERHDEMD